MPPKRTSIHAKSDVSSVPVLDSVPNSPQEFSYFHQYPTIRRILAVLIFIIVVGVPCPPQFFYSTFIAHNTWLHLFRRAGVFSDAVFLCEQAVGPLYTHDHEYYRKFQAHLNLTDEAMFGYLQQWMCVMPPDNYGMIVACSLCVLLLSFVIPTPSNVHAHVIMLPPLQYHIYIDLLLLLWLSMMCRWVHSGHAIEICRIRSRFGSVRRHGVQRKRRVG